mgnify:FL=1
MNSRYLNIYNNLIKLTRNKSLYKISNNIETFSDRLTIFLLHFAFFLKIYKKKILKKELQRLYDFVFRQIETSAREIGYGDSSINKRMKEYVNLTHAILENIDTWEKLSLNKKLDFFSKYVYVGKESSFYVDYFDKYSFYLSKNSFNYFTKDVISHKF